MNWKVFSIVAFLLAVAAIVYLAYHDALFGTEPISIAVQVLALALMLWARLTFGIRSFHAGANPTAGGLVTHGPYRFIRHPIYAAIIYFLIAGLAVHASIVNAIVTGIAMLGLAGRIIAEEKLLIAKYPEYTEYMHRSKRVVPFVL